jgi:Uma2 family endonuclease
MSIAVQKPKQATLAAVLPMPYRLSVAQYHRMIELGILTENDRVELLDGWILPKMTHNPPHDATVSFAQAELQPRVPGEWLVRIQSAITLATSEPEPDVAVVRGPARRYVRSHPRPRDIAVLIEVADATLVYDRVAKGELYARARIPVYWIINLVDARIEVYADPRAGKAPAYRRRQNYGPNEAVPLILAGQEIGSIPVRDLLP